MSNVYRIWPKGPRDELEKVAIKLQGILDNSPHDRLPRSLWEDCATATRTISQMMDVMMQSENLWIIKSVLRKEMLQYFYILAAAVMNEFSSSATLTANNAHGSLEDAGSSSVVALSCLLEVAGAVSSFLRLLRSAEARSYTLIMDADFDMFGQGRNMRPTQNGRDMG